MSFHSNWYSKRISIYIFLFRIVCCILTFLSHKISAFVLSHKIRNQLYAMGKLKSDTITKTNIKMDRTIYQVSLVGHIQTF